MFWYIKKLTLQRYLDLDFWMNSVFVFFANPNPKNYKVVWSSYWFNTRCTKIRKIITNDLTAVWKISSLSVDRPIFPAILVFSGNPISKFIAFPKLKSIHGAVLPQRESFKYWRETLVNTLGQIGRSQGGTI